MARLTKSQKQYQLDLLMQKTLISTGFVRLKKEKRTLLAKFPDLSFENKAPPCRNGFAKAGFVKPIPPDAKQFPVGNSHKQGPMLITSFDDLQYMGGKKT